MDQFTKFRKVPGGIHALLLRVFAVCSVGVSLVACNDTPLEVQRRAIRADLVTVSTNTHTALQNAINAACSTPGGPDTVDLGNQTFVLEGRLFIPGNVSDPCGDSESTRIVVRNGTLLGQDTSYFPTGNSTTRAWVIMNEHYVTLENITVQGPWSAFQGTTMPAGCTFQTTPVNQSRCINGVSASGNANRLNNVTVTNHFGYGLHVYMGSNGTISNSRFSTNVISGILMDQSTGWIIEDSKSSNNGENGIDVFLGGGHYIVSDTFANNGYYGVGGDQQGILLNESADNRVEWNHIYGNKIGILGYRAGNQIYENTIYNNQGEGILIGVVGESGTIAVTPYMMVYNNIVHHNGQAGIKAGYTPFGNSGTSAMLETHISENIVYSNAGMYDRDQIEFAGTHADTHVSYNTITRPAGCMPTSYTGVTFDGNSCSW
jgi:parallel beta-helix repeat protein